MTLYNLVKTCEACSAQWEATNERGEGVYIRYRYDTLAVYCPHNDGDDWETYNNSLILEIEGITGDELIGVMEEEEMLRLTGYTKGN